MSGSDDHQPNLDAAARDRIWRRTNQLIDTQAASHATDRRGVRRGGATRAMPDRRPWRVLTAAAAAVLVAAVGAVVVTAQGPQDEAVRAGPADQTSAPGGPKVTELPSLDEVADTALAREVPVLGVDGAYAWRTATITIGADGEEPTVAELALWVGLDGTGRAVDPSAATDPDEGIEDEPGSLGLGGLPADVAVGLPDDADAVLAAGRAVDPGSDLIDRDLAKPLLDTLGFAGLPPTARAGMLRALDVVGFRPVTVDGAVVTYRGPGPAGATVDADIDSATGFVERFTYDTPEGQEQTVAVEATALRPDLVHP